MRRLSLPGISIGLLLLFSCQSRQEKSSPEANISTDTVIASDTVSGTNVSDTAGDSTGSEHGTAPENRNPNPVPPKENGQASGKEAITEIRHGSPGKARIDSIKNAKRDQKFK